MILSEFDIVKAVEEGIEYTVLYPFDNPSKKIEAGTESDMKLFVKGAGCKEYDAKLALMLAYQTECKEKEVEPDPVKAKELFIDVLVACTTGWQGVEEIKNGEAVPIKFSAKTAKDYYMKHEWLGAQVWSAISKIDEMLQKNCQAS